MASSASDTLLALDFDGVLCDSCGESSLSGWKVRERPAPSGSFTAPFDTHLSCVFHFECTRCRETPQSAKAVVGPVAVGADRAKAAAATNFSQATVKLWPEVFKLATDAQRVRPVWPGQFRKGVANKVSRECGLSQPPVLPNSTLLYSALFGL